MVPAWATAGRRVKRVVTNRSVPLLALGAAYCFIVMMFNVPVPDGTTAHAVGGVLVAVLLGPWAAVVALSTALLMQALFFGDGGVLAFGANCFNMALVMPFVGYGVYLALARRAPLTARRRAVAAGVGAYVGLNVAALCAAIEFGIQPELFTNAQGAPLYAPFPLSQTVPTMLFAHLVVAGVVDAVLTTAVVAYLQRANVPVLRVNHPAIPETEREVAAPVRIRWRGAWVALGVLVVLTPIGLLAPGSAFGEDAPRTLRPLQSVFNGYDVTNAAHPNLGYILSALVGATLVVVAILAVWKLAARPPATDVHWRPSEERQCTSVGKRATPAWLLEREVALCPCGCVGVRRKGNFIDKTLNGSAGVLRNAVFAEDTATRAGLLQRVDPRVKVVTLLGLLVAVAFIRSLPVLVVAYAATLLLAVLSALPLGQFVRRVWLFVPIFTGIVVLPATLNLITPGTIVVPLGTWFGHDVGVTSQGLTGAVTIVARVATSISLVVLLTLTTPWTRLLAALRALFVPRSFIVVFTMAYRYLFHLLNAVIDMYTARRARTAGVDRDTASGRAFVGATAGALFGKTHALSEEVHMAMVSRGYRGDARTLTAFRITSIDVAWTVAAVATMIMIVGFGHG
jgi:cobalt ECF transporter T component CbiQ/cobalamin biosynthesis protein CbiM